MAFVRVTRDKRGYEHIYLMRAAGQRGKSGSPHVLYVFRTPPGIRVGREPFDDTVRRTIEDQNPGVHFDWQKLSVILPPPPDVEYWRERRRAEKAAKQAQRDGERAESAPRDAASSTASQVAESNEGLASDEEAAEDETSAEVAGSGSQAAEGPAPASMSPTDSPAREGHRRRRRRRGGRGRKGPARPENLAQLPGSPNVPDDPLKER